MEKQENKVIPTTDFIRLANSFYQQANIPIDMNRIGIDVQLSNYIASNKEQLKKYKVALLCICSNPHYWEYAKQMIEGAKQFFLPGHKTDVLLWTDMPEFDDTKAFEEAEQKLLGMRFSVPNLLDIEISRFGFVPQQISLLNKIGEVKKFIEENVKQEIKGIIDRGKEGSKIAHTQTVFPIEPIDWPMPTLLRYHTFLQQEEKLKEYDYLFYCDVDMLFVGIVGDEILSDLTAAQHPMYALDKKFIPPYEPNKDSAAYIPRPGVILNEQGKFRFLPLYYAGGFQGGKTEKFIEAMKVMRKQIDEDFKKNYIAIWNDESHWNRYLFDNPPTQVLNPSYIYPDSLINEYYIPIWGTNYVPRLITLTKKFSLTPQGGDHVQKMIQQFQNLK